MDLAVLEKLCQPTKMLMVASGGCTAATLVASGRLSDLHLVDPNPAQLALARIKLYLLFHFPPRERLQILGHQEMSFNERRRRVVSITKNLNVCSGTLGPEDVVSNVGLDYAGRYEMVFAELRRELTRSSVELEALLQLADPNEQARRVVKTTPLGKDFDRAFSKVMSLPNLVQLFGQGATANRVESFAKHFARRTRHVLASLPAAQNPFLAQVLIGRFLNGYTYPWLQQASPVTTPSLTWSNTTMQEVLQKVHPGSFHFIHLSNILDWLSPAEAEKTLDSTWRALANDGFVFIRQLNSRLDIPASGQRFQWLDKQAQRMHQQDRSFFYRALHLGQKQ